MKTIKQVFPFYILLMVCYEQTLSLLINYTIYDSRQLVIYTCWIPVILLPYYLFKKKFFYKIAVVLLFVEGFINVCHLLVLKGPVNASSLFILSNTNSNEAKDFIYLKFSLYLVLIFPYLFLFIMALKNRFSIVSYPKSKWIVSVILLFSLLFIADNLINKRLIRKGIPHTTKAIISFVEEQKSYNALQKRVVANVPTKFMSEKWKQQIFVLIIGESCNRNHMSLYNYHTETNPRLGKRNDIIVYKNVVSPYSNTLNSVLTILTEANLENKMSIDKSISLIDVFHSADYKTFWLSNQSPIGVWDNAIYNIAHTSDVATFVNNNGNSSYESTYLSSYDEKLFSPFYTALNEKTKNKFIVIHLMGSHSTYSKRYPIAYCIIRPKVYHQIRSKVYHRIRPKCTT